MKKLRNLLGWCFLVLPLAVMAQAADEHLVDASPMSVEGTVAIDNAEAKALFDRGVVFVDVRTRRGYDSGRIPDAELLDLEQDFNQAALAELVKPDQEVVFYCQGPRCKRTAEACKRAVSWGYSKVYYYRDGFPGWKAAGYPVE